MRVSVFGLGYVGVVTAVCLASRGHQITGVDVNPDKARLLRAQTPPFVEPGLLPLLASTLADGSLRLVDDGSAAARASELSIICVGTPALPDGSPDLGAVFHVYKEICTAVLDQPASEPHTIVLRSTSPPGTTLRCAAGMPDSAQARIRAVFNPEFLREGSAIRDFMEPPYTVVGAERPEDGEPVERLYEGIPAPLIRCRTTEAELVKYTSNAWHAVKISFANEVGRLASGLGVDGEEVMQILRRDTKLNISDAYLRPGFAYGGSCLPKDVAALQHLARAQHLRVPLLDAISQSNDAHVDSAYARVMSRRPRPRRILMLGVAFKPGTDDLRESPAVKLAKRLIGEGCEVALHDPSVEEAHLLGTNLEFIRANLPHFEELFVTAEWCKAGGEPFDLIVATHGLELYADVLAAPAMQDGVDVVDLTRPPYAPSAAGWAEPPHWHASAHGASSPPVDSGQGRTT